MKYILQSFNCSNSILIYKKKAIETNIFIENYNSGDNIYEKQVGLKEYSLKLMSNLVLLPPPPGAKSYNNWQEYYNRNPYKTRSRI